MSIPPLFIVGCPRSGTTLLGGLLGQTRWGARSESHFIAKYFRRLPRYGDLSRAGNRARLLRDILRERPVMQWKLAIDADRFVEDPATADYAVLVDRLCLERVRPRGLPAWGDKTPHYIFELDVLDRLFPRARFLHVVRDGRDVALSLLAKRWGPNNVYACARFWKRCTEETAPLRKLREDGRLLEIRYEDLVSEPLETTRRIHGFLGEPFDAAALSARMETVVRDNFRKWEKRMTPGEIRLFESVAAGSLRRLGYDVTHAEVPVGRLTRLRWRVHDAVLSAAHVVRLNTLDAFRIRFRGKDPFRDPSRRRARGAGG